MPAWILPRVNQANGSEKAKYQRGAIDIREELST
jgi:hypothetical protein